VTTIDRPNTPAMIATEMVMVGVNEIMPHPQNPRVGDVESIAESITENGYFAPVGVQRSTGFVLYGNHRLLAARLAGLAEVPVVWLDVDDVHATRIMIADNRYAEKGTWDDRKLLDLLDDFDLDGLLGTGYDDIEREMLRASFDDPELPPPPDKGIASNEVKVQIGTWSFTVTRDAWEAFEADVTREAGTRHEGCIDLLRMRLAL